MFPHSDRYLKRNLKPRSPENHAQKSRRKKASRKRKISMINAFMPATYPKRYQAVCLINTIWFFVFLFCVPFIPVICDSSFSRLSEYFLHLKLALFVKYYWALFSHALQCFLFNMLHSWNDRFACQTESLRLQYCQHPISIPLASQNKYVPSCSD